MDSLYSKAFWLGRSLNFISFMTGSVDDTPDNESLAHMRRMVKGFSKALKIRIKEIPALKTGEDFLNLREGVRSELHAVQSQLVSTCFAFGYDYSAFVILRVINDRGQMAAGREMSNAEKIMREAAADIGLLAELEQSLAAANDPTLDGEAFENQATDIMVRMGEKLDAMDPAHLKTGAAPKSKDLFIVMPMLETDPSLDDVLITIQNTATALGLEANRVDELEDSGRITDSIVDGLRRAAYVVVDLTHARPNVYWEAGFTHGLGKIPIYIARKDTKLEFDVKDYPVIYFANNKMLGEKLATRLRQLMQTAG